MSVPTLLVAVDAVAVVWGVVAGTLIFDSLRRRGETDSRLWIRRSLLRAEEQ
jgi:hypothetical protein